MSDSHISCCHGASVSQVGKPLSSCKRYQLIDAFRVLCACLVVLIHCLEIQEGHPFAHMIVVCFSQQAVPFFFIVSGFFLANKMYSSSDSMPFVIAYVKSQLLLYAAWMIIEFPWMLANYHNLYGNRSFLYLFAIITRRVFFAGQGVYWYILVLAEAALFAGICIKHKHENFLYATALIGCILGFIYDANISILFFGKLNHVVYSVFSWSNNFLMKGLPYVTLGIFLANNNRRIAWQSAHLVAAYSCISLISIFLFCLCLRFDIQMKRFMFLYPMQATLLFCIALRSDCKIFDNKTCESLREISSTIYFLHTVMIYRIVDVIWTVNSPIFLKFSISVSLSLSVYWLAKQSKFKPLCWLLSIKA